jgi:hypothetical protein
MKLFTVKTGRKRGFIRSCCYKAKKNIMEGLSVIFGKGCFPGQNTWLVVL